MVLSKVSFLILGETIFMDVVLLLFFFTRSPFFFWNVMDDMIFDVIIDLII